jgi:hypothetical protein
MVQTHEEKLAKRRQWYRNRADKERARKRIYGAKNKDIINEKSRIWYENNRERSIETARIYQAKCRHKKKMATVFLDIVSI